MILLFALIMCQWANEAAAQSGAVQRIETCGIKCSQGLQCTSKPHYWFPALCRSVPNGFNSSSVIKNVSLSTVMMCEGKQKCSLHLRIRTTLRLSEFIHGLSVCTMTAGMMGSCKLISFTRASREMMTGLLVEAESGCSVISPTQQVVVTIKTEPSYCGAKSLTNIYEAPDCSNEDFQKHVPQCITGRLSYDVNPEMKTLSVSVSDMLEDEDYHVRLCHKHFICMGTGVHTLIRKEEPVKNVTLPYSRPLPCLCIEGWSAVTDAPRIQVCPFKNRLGELWSGINFDPEEEALSWEPLCPITAVVALCQRKANGVCSDLPHASQDAKRKKVTFAKVDPHPQLCIKFTVGSQFWIRCPFVHGKFQAWEVATATRHGHQEEVTILSKISAAFSVGLCMKSEESPECQSSVTHTVYVEKHQHVGLNLTWGLCKTGSCFQVKRLDVKYGATVIHCLLHCNQSSAYSEVTWIIVTTGVCLTVVIIVTLVLHILLTVYQRRKQKQHRWNSDKQTDSALNFVVPALEPVLDKQTFIPDSPQCGNFERAILLSD
ncbi:putative interleukin-17 receptor E-like [Thalassophryne amazonica]|uniref:putative interleukin-17 receptor E-like n=1 Tax=Thalassophryne amazonica TaxID=390379 RepID=UPI001471BF5B|nr:putative interleukin-17 receptor E-like [Thalassophryne amazonica]